MKIFSSLVIGFCFLLSSFVQAQSLRLGIKPQKDSLIYYVVNETSEPVLAGAIICTWFHNTELMVFWPADLGIGLGTVTKTGTFSGKNTVFNRRTTQRISFDFDIYPGDSQEFVTVQNYSEEPQEVMCTNVRIFYSDTAGIDHESDVYPIDQNPCPFKQVFMVGNLTNDGIRFWTTANRPLHYSTTCLDGFAVVVINRTTLEPIPVKGQTPFCSDGRKWKSFGYPIDEQVYYNFDFRDTTHITAFVDLIAAIEPGDHVFISHASRNTVDLRNPRVQKALEQLGGDANLASYQNDLYAGKILMGYGNKQSDPGTLELFADKDVKKEYVLLPDQVYDESKSFAPCFEATLREAEKAQIVIDTNSNTTLGALYNKGTQIFPNPVEDILRIFTHFPQDDIQLMAVNGKKLPIPIFYENTKQYRLNVESLSRGIYILKVGNEVFRVIKD